MCHSARIPETFDSTQDAEINFINLRLNVVVVVGIPMFKISYGARYF